MTHYLKSLDLAWLEPKPCNLAIGKASLKFKAFVRDRQVIANENLSVSRFMFKRSASVTRLLARRLLSRWHGR